MADEDYREFDVHADCRDEISTLRAQLAEREQAYARLRKERNEISTAYHTLHARVAALEEALHIALAFARRYDGESPDEMDECDAEWEAAWTAMTRLVPSLRTDADETRTRLRALLPERKP